MIKLIKHVIKLHTKTINFFIFSRNYKLENLSKKINYNQHQTLEMQ